MDLAWEWEDVIKCNGDSDITVNSHNKPDKKKLLSSEISERIETVNISYILR